MPITRRTPARSRPRGRQAILLRVVVAALLVVLVPVSGQAAPARRAASATLTVSDAVAHAGEQVTLRGRVPAQGTRRVVLERRAATRWVRVARAATTRSGAFRFVTSAPGVRTSYRVRALKARQRGAVLRAVVTPTRTVTPSPSTVTTPPTTTSSTPATVDPGGVPTAANLAVTATASSYAAGREPQRLLGRAVGAAGPGWESRGETTGAWVELGLGAPQLVRRVVVERDPLTEPGIVSGYLSFDDGSSVQVALSTTSPSTVLPFTPRQASRVRFTVTAVAGGGTAARLRSVQVQGGPELPLVDVSTSAQADGDTASTAALTASSADPRALVDGGPGGVGAPWTPTSSAGSWVRMDWLSPRELTTLTVAGTTSGSLLKSATLQFSDGSTLPLGAVSADPTRPTVLSFMPRVARWVRLGIDTTSGSGDLRLAEISLLQRGAAALRTPGGPAAPYTDRPVDCGSTARPSDTTGLLVLCPTNGAQVGGRATVAVALGPSYTSVQATVWPAQGSLAPSTPTTLTPGAGGRGTFDLDLSALPAGPLTVNLVATSPSAAPRTAYLGLYRSSTAPADPSTSPQGPGAGRSLVWAEEFDRSLSLSRTGESADYATAKPERTYGADFGDAIFADSTYGLGNVRTVDGRYLKISTQPNPSGFSDPQKWGRTRVGGMLASARPGGGGFSAQYAYFEARMLLPAGTGTWPAFWMLPSNNLITDLPMVAEIDALEHYGHNPQGACHTSHQYPDPDRVGVALCTGRRWATDREALSWHTFGVAVDPTRIRYVVDGIEVASAPQVQGGGDPMFWLVNLSLGGGWPIDLSPTQDRTDLYVDYVRVYV